jgi:hypothetical protein
MNTQQLQVIAASMQAIAAAAAGGRLVAIQVTQSRRGMKITVNYQGAINGSFDMIKPLSVLTEIILVMLHCSVLSSI